MIPLAKDHTGMRVSARILLEHPDDSGPYRALLTELYGNLTEMAQRYYAGDIAAVDEFLQFYRLGRDAREKVKAAQGSVK